jgi:hypothetical protein
MANTYTWTVNNMVSYPQAEGYTDVVVTINWSCNGTDGTYYGALVGKTDVKLDPNAPYTPYANLTEEQVVSWVWETIGPNQVTATQNAVAQQIANNYYTPTILPNPWSA